MAKNFACRGAIWKHPRIYTGYFKDSAYRGARLPENSEHRCLLRVFLPNVPCLLAIPMQGTGLSLFRADGLIAFSTSCTQARYTSWRVALTQPGDLSWLPLSLVCYICYSSVFLCFCCLLLYGKAL